MKFEFYNQYTESLEEKETKGQAVYIEESFDACKTLYSVEKVRLAPDREFVTVTGGIRGQWQRACVINALLSVDEDWEEKYVIPPEKVKKGDTVYAYIGGDGDCYGDGIVGVFTRKLTDEEIKFIEKIFSEEDLTWLEYVYEEPTELIIE